MPDKISKKYLIKFTLNGKAFEDEIDSRILLSDYIRDDLGQTGTHVGCEHGICGACTIHINGRASRSCLTLAVQADGCIINTIESIANNDKNLSIIQNNFKKYFALQCGFCTPGIIMTLSDYLYRNKDASEKDIRNILSGHLCRCTGYQPIIKAAIQSAKEINDE